MQCILKKMNKNTEIKHPKLDYSFNHGIRAKTFLRRNRLSGFIIYRKIKPYLNRKKNGVKGHHNHARPACHNGAAFATVLTVKHQ